MRTLPLYLLAAINRDVGTAIRIHNSDAFGGHVPNFNMVFAPRQHMANRCEYLEYRRGANGTEFDTERAYCTVVDQFIQPMRADICNARYDLRPERDCEYYEIAKSSDSNRSGDTGER